ncbi:MAG: MarR family transcriptional regulator [Candidatus Azobacteroides sp.]|nr:MarR family transcriptional regulator [Candidatus Azobacteroides sp.]
MNELEIKDRQFIHLDQLIWGVTKLLYRKKKSLLHEFDLTCLQFDILATLFYLAQKNEEIIQVELAEKAQINPMTTSKVVRELQKRNLIRRNRGAVNTRTVTVELTEDGKNLYSLANSKIEKMIIQVGVSTDRPQTVFPTTPDDDGKIKRIRFLK